MVKSSGKLRLGGIASVPHPVLFLEGRRPQISDHPRAMTSRRRQGPDGHGPAALLRLQ